MDAKIEHLKICMKLYATAREAYFDAPALDNHEAWLQLIAAARVLADNLLENKELLGE
jgi:hypothetical protein